MEGREKELGPYFILRWAHWIQKFCCIAAHCITVQTQERVQHTALHDSTVRTRYLHSIRHLALYNIIRHFVSMSNYSWALTLTPRLPFGKRPQLSSDALTQITQKTLHHLAKNICHRDKRHKTHTHTMKRTSIKLQIFVCIYTVYSVHIGCGRLHLSLKEKQNVSHEPNYCRWNPEIPTHMCFFS